LMPEAFDIVVACDLGEESSSSNPMRLTPLES
jgi:hypothetical protein